MYPYRQLWKNLAQTAKKLNQQLINFIYIEEKQAFTPPPQTRKQAKSILLSDVFFQWLLACLSSFKILCHATKDFHSYKTNKAIFMLGKNKFD